MGHFWVQGREADVAGRTGRMSIEPCHAALLGWTWPLRIHFTGLDLSISPPSVTFPPSSASCALEAELNFVARQTRDLALRMGLPRTVCMIERCVRGAWRASTQASMDGLAGEGSHLIKRKGGGRIQRTGPAWSCPVCTLFAFPIKSRGERRPRKDVYMECSPLIRAACVNMDTATVRQET